MPDLTKQEHIKPDGVRLLSIDGGGVRGIVGLLVLKKIMESIKDQELARDPTASTEDRHPAQYFDLAGGTGTGGLVCIMLFRLRMSVQEAIDAYAELSCSIFRSSFASRKLGGFAIKTVIGRPWFKGEVLETIIKRKITGQHLPEDAQLLEPGSTSCKTFVCTLRKHDNLAVRLRSYHLWDGSLPEHHYCPIWKAALATSAAPFYFPEASIGHSKFWDGGVANNNPIDEVWVEKSLLFQKQAVKCVISLGTGRREMAKKSSNLLARHPAMSRGGRLLTNLTNVENVHRRFEDLMKAESIEYFRFDPSTLEDDIGMSDYDKIPKLQEYTEIYLAQPPIQAIVKICAQLLCYGS
ncbi:acyl transferase/acyl hydrolase/lysophospholipase [Mariannaea sp. PMI_226]|nr:acyl transferase/acyl hydrolase/lysophospholipase [Mariannaea sp. PMI_226]